jgi:hypothetical protein
MRGVTQVRDQYLASHKEKVRHAQQARGTAPSGVITTTRITQANYTNADTGAASAVAGDDHRSSYPRSRRSYRTWRTAYSTAA